MDAVGADGLTNEQWVESSRPGADPELAVEQKDDNKNKKVILKRIRKNKRRVKIKI